MPRKGSCKSPTSVVYYSLCIEKKASVSSFRTHYASNFPSFIEKFGLNKKHPYNVVTSSNTTTAHCFK